LEDNQLGGCRLDPKKSRREIFQRIFALGIIWGDVGRYAATPLLVALSPSHSDKTRFRPWSSTTTGNHLDRAEKIPKLVQTTGTVAILIRVRAFRDPLREELPHAQIFMNDGPSPLT